MTITGIDISSNNQKIIDWASVKRSGVDFAVVKATGGTTYLNPRYREQIDGARAAGILVGHYHYWLEPSMGTPQAEPEEEADFFLANLDLQPGEFVALDLEEHPQRGDLAEIAARWLAHVEAATGIVPFFYTYESLIAEEGLGTTTLARAPLWLAHYWESRAPAPWPQTPGEWAGIRIWQYSDQGSRPGVGHVDLNLFYGTADDLRALGKPDAAERPAGGGAPVSDESAETTIGPDGVPVTTIRWGGQAVGVEGTNFADIGLSVRNASGEVFDRSLQAGAFTPWTKRP